MSRKRLGLAVLALAGIAAVTLAATPFATGAKSDTKRITLFSVPSAVEFFYIKDMDGSGNVGFEDDPTVGDLALFRSDLATKLGGPAIARWRGAACLLTGDEQNSNLEVECHGTIAFDRGALQLEWSNVWGELVSNVAVVGGTGIYRDAGGDGTIDLTQEGAPIALRITGVS